LRPLANFDLDLTAVAGAMIIPIKCKEQMIMLIIIAYFVIKVKIFGNL
jgi:hypothetical protein